MGFLFLVTCISQLASTAALYPIREPKILSRDHIRPDMQLFNFNLGRDALLDVAITCPTPDKYTREAASKPLHAANEHAKQVKEAQYLDATLAHNMDFIPLVLESTGGWCDAGNDFVKRLARLTLPTRNQPSQRPSGTSIKDPQSSSRDPTVSW